MVLTFRHRLRLSLLPSPMRSGLSWLSFSCAEALWRLLEPFRSAAGVDKTPAPALSGRPVPTGAELPGGGLPPGPSGKGRSALVYAAGKAACRDLRFLAPAFTIMALRPSPRGGGLKVCPCRRFSKRYACTRSKLQDCCPLRYRGSGFLPLRQHPVITGQAPREASGAKGPTPGRW